MRLPVDYPIISVLRPLRFLHRLYRGDICQMLVLPWSLVPRSIGRLSMAANIKVRTQESRRTMSKHVIRRQTSLLKGLAGAVAALLAMPSLASAQEASAKDEVFTQSAAITLPAEAPRSRHSTSAGSMPFLKSTTWAIEAIKLSTSLIRAQRFPHNSSQCLPRRRRTHLSVLVA